MEEIHQLFIDLATLIQSQGEQLDSIEANIMDANNYVEKAEKKLDSAKKWHQKARTVSEGLSRAVENVLSHGLRARHLVRSLVRRAQNPGLISHFSLISALEGR